MGFFHFRKKDKATGNAKSPGAPPSPSASGSSSPISPGPSASTFFPSSHDPPPRPSYSGSRSATPQQYSEHRPNPALRHRPAEPASLPHSHSYNGMASPVYDSRSVSQPAHLGAPRGHRVEGSWEDLGAPLSTTPSTADEPAAFSRGAIFRGTEGSSTLSLPIAPTPADSYSQGTAPPPVKSSRWGLPKRPKLRTGSVSSMSVLDGVYGLGTKEKESGFVVKSFRNVSHVREDPISPGPYESMPSHLSSSPPRKGLSSGISPSLPPAPLPSPTSTIFPPTALSSHPPRSGSPTISVKQFQLASQARSRSTTSILSLSSAQEANAAFQPPRFEPTRRGSDVSSSTPRPPFARQNFNISEPTLPKSDSGASFASYYTAAPDQSVELDLSDDMKIFALYGDSSPPTTSAALPPLASPPLVPRVGSLATPSVSVQPASPVPSKGSTPPKKEMGKLSPSLAGKGKAANSRGFTSWTSHSSDEESSDEDEIPLARLSHNRSQESLHKAAQVDTTRHSRTASAPSSPTLPNSPSASTLHSLSRPLSHEIEVLEMRPSASTPSTSSGGLRRISLGQQQRSISALSFSASRSYDNSPSPPSPNLGPRTHSTPQVPPSADRRSSFSSSPSSSKAPTPKPASHHSSSSSGSGSGFSLPVTPKDSGSPISSNLGIPPIKSIRFQEDAFSIDSDARKVRPRPSMQSLQPGHQRGFSASSSAAPKLAPPRSASSLGLATGPRSSFAAQQAASTPPQSTNVFDRMKARHRVEAAGAEKIGRDLNSPSGRVPDPEEDEDDEAPLAALSQRGRTSSANAVPLSSSPQQSFFLSSPSMSAMGGFGMLAIAPPGVDPYLYASLPPDQKMSLHQRSQQMMAMMAQAAQQAKAESMGGWETGSNMSGASSSPGPPRPTHTQQSASMGQFGMWPPSQSMLFNPYAPPPASMMHLPRLPAFAPPASASQQFFQQQAYPGFGGSVIGFPTTTPASAMGYNPTHRKGAGSTIGFATRR